MSLTPKLQRIHLETLLSPNLCDHGANVNGYILPHVGQAEVTAKWRAGDGSRFFRGCLDWFTLWHSPDPASRQRKGFKATATSIWLWYTEARRMSPRVAIDVTVADVLLSPLGHQGAASHHLHGLCTAKAQRLYWTLWLHTGASQRSVTYSRCLFSDGHRHLFSLFPMFFTRWDTISCRHH